MIDFFRVLPVEEARKRLLEAWQVPPISSERVALQEAFGRVLALDLVSREHIPPYSRSTVDGYAVMAKDTFGATQSLPAILEITMDVPMGELAKAPLLPGQAARIPTGGALPQGADACVMIEHTEVLDEGTVLVQEPASPGENMVLPGEDISQGEVVIESGRILRPSDIGALAALGTVSVPVVKRPRIAIVSTGDEIVPPESQVAPGQIRDINSYSISAMAENLGARPTILGIAKDTYDDVRRLVMKGLASADMVAVSGGSSVGTRDVTVKVLDDLGPPGVIVHGVAVKPGKPVILAICQNKPVFGLPGHPVSAMVSFDLFVRTAIEVMLRSRAPELFVDAKLSRNLSSAPGRQDRVRVSLREAEGVLWADPLLGKSGLIKTMVKADGEIVIPTEKEGLIAGSYVRVRVFWGAIR